VHINIAKAPARSVYVPAPKRESTSEQRPRFTRLPPHRAVAPIAELLRAIPWSGEAKAAPPPPRRRERVRLGAHVKAREVFARVRWTGEAPGEPTAAQARASVKAVFDSFGWE